MNIISRNLREWCDEVDVDGDSSGEPRAIADRIDREMVELPKDADGVPIHIGDVVYGSPGIACTVVGLRMSFRRRVAEMKMDWLVYVDERPCFYAPGDLTHKEPEPADSWEKLEEDAASGVACDYVLDMIARAKKLAGIVEEATE